MLSIIIDGNEFSLDDGVHATLVGYDGWGASPSRRLSSQGPLQHGDTDEGQRLQPRFGSLVLQAPSTELDDLYIAREALLDLINPEDEIILKWDLPYGTRQFDVVYYDDMQMAWEPREWANLKFAVVLKASDPTCYDPTVQIKTFVGTASTAFLVPLTLNVFVGGSTIDQVQTVEYEGNWNAYPTVQIDGPATNPIVENLETGEKLDFTGLALASGQSRIVDTRYGFKTVVDGSGVNQIQDLTDDSDLATFHIERKRAYESHKNNDLKVTVSGVDSNTRVVVRWNNRFIGI